MATGKLGKFFITDELSGDIMSFTQILNSGPNRNGDEFKFSENKGSIRAQFEKCVDGEAVMSLAQDMDRANPIRYGSGDIFNGIDLSKYGCGSGSF